MKITEQLQFDLDHKLPNHLVSGRKQTCSFWRRATAKKTGNAVIFSASLLGRIWNGMLYSLGFRRTRGSATMLDTLGTIPRYSGARCCGGERNEHRMEGLPPPLSATFLSSDLSLSYSSKGRSVRNESRHSGTARASASGGAIWRRSNQINMPVVVIAPLQRSSFPYSFPDTGKVRIVVETSRPVDIFVALSSQSSLLSSVWSAKQNGIFTLPTQQKVDTVLTLPDQWRAVEWSLVVANPAPETVGVYYMVYTA